MIKKLGLAGLLILITAGVAYADCPALVTGTTAEAIEANQLRLICLQREVSAASRQRQYELQLQSLETTVQNNELRQRFDALPPIYVPPTVPQVPSFPSGG